MDRPAQTQVLGDQLPGRVEGPVRFSQIHQAPSPYADGLALVSLDCNDVDAVYRLAAESFPAIWSEKDFCYFLGHETRLCLGLASEAPDGPRLHAYFLGLLVQGDLDIISLATRAIDRRLGLAERLIREVCRAPGVERAFLEVETDNAAALGLYSKVGFERLGRRPAYYGPGRDAFLMSYTRPKTSTAPAPTL